jgi:hypothetical protein
MIVGETEKLWGDDERVEPSVSSEEPLELYRPPALVTPNKDDVGSTCGEIDASCSDMLDNVDSCVGCVNQIDLQHDFEDSMAELPLPEFRKNPPYKLSEVEASLMRLQIMEQQSDDAQALSNLPDMDLLNFCGYAEDIHVSPARQPSSLEAEGSAEFHQRASVAACSAATEELLSSPKQCTICSDAVNGMHFPELPCCRETSICTACIRLLTHPITAEGQRAGRCPSCRSWITAKPIGSESSVEVEMEIAVVDPVADQNCSVCNQVKDYMLVQDGQSVCDACFLGRRHPLEYECQCCSVRQRIPHPMYRYQVAPGEFGTVAWACSQGDCGKFTRWRICADQLGMIPVADAPWGDNAIQVARQRVQERRYLTQGQALNEECVIL